MPPEAQSILDTRGLSCPMPVLRAQKQLRTLSAGAVLELVSSDAVSWNEVPAFCEQAGHRLIHREAANDEWRFWIEKRPSS